MQVQVLQAFLFELKCLEHFVKCFGVKPTSEGTPTDWLLPPMQMLLARFKLTCFQHTESVTRQLASWPGLQRHPALLTLGTGGEGGGQSGAAVLQRVQQGSEAGGDSPRARRRLPRPPPVVLSAVRLQVVNTMYSFCVATGDPTAVTSNVKGMEQVVEGQHLLESTIPFSMAQRVTYQYYFGRGRVFTGDVATAEDRLGFAFEQCHRDCRLNKRCILVYLVPARMLRGRLPSVRLLQKYNLPQYLDLREAVRQGNLSAFQRTMDAHQGGCPVVAPSPPTGLTPPPPAFFIRTGVYMALERLRTVVTRNLFQKVHAAHVAMTRYAALHGAAHASGAAAHCRRAARSTRATRTTICCARAPRSRSSTSRRRSTRSRATRLTSTRLSASWPT